MGMREKLIELIQSAVNGCATYWAGLIADYLIANGVTIPVRCKDCANCQHKTPLDGFFCKGFRVLVKPDDFCSYGERRTDG